MKVLLRIISWPLRSILIMLIEFKYASLTDDKKRQFDDCYNKSSMKKKYEKH
jgi:hypothetical protein